MTARLLAFVLIGVVAVAYTLVRYARVGADLFDPAYRVTVELADAGGLFDGSEVTYRGVPIGRVESLAVAGDGARAVLRLGAGTPVQAGGLLAVVANRSGVGEQYLDLRPAGGARPYLREGDVIGRGQTRLPVATAQLLGDTDRLLSSVDPRDLETVVTELGKGLGGNGPYLRRLADAGERLLGQAESVLPETVAVLRDGETVLDAQRASGGHLRAFAGDLASLTDSLKKGRGDLAHVSGRTPRATGSVERLLNGVAPDLRPLLTHLVIGGRTAGSRVTALRQLLIGYPAAVAGAFSVVDRDGVHFGLDLDLNVPRPCTRGYERVRRRDPHDVSPRPVDPGAFCKEPRGSATGVRGARNAPAPQPPPSIPGLGKWLAGYDPATGRKG
ncbi:ABC transporter substrate-binding protein [Nonomuraea sp. WAC 01424]|uniref:MCE family protein n=1 Tax=Nonomuraea sp. WAC 01424 TaxID=2203200 RepID=UPI000F79CBF8|nr:MlaD family protein [Nonomuraea sp. WAC 01424]RSN01791.1 ABC transporter substrate-binding protein [Nonomuraea sp. WAC 01424]